MKHVGFVTCAQFPHMTDSDSLTIEPLRKRGIEVEPIIWTSPPLSLIKFDAIIMRSAWDYHLHTKEFLSFLQTIKQSQIPVYNSIDTIMWNMNKSYLLELKEKGAPIVSTIKIDSLYDIPWQIIKNWKTIIIKPCFGGSAYRIVKQNSFDVDHIKNEIQNLLLLGNVLIQPFMHEIYNGEYSFIFYNKQLSHTVLKKPKTTDFRTQSEYGGEDSIIIPSQILQTMAHNIIHLIKEPLLYARLDAIEVNGSLQLMELELIEPHLFLEAAPEKAIFFADAIAQTI